jgi:hypothetical protein
VVVRSEASTVCVTVDFFVNLPLAALPAPMESEDEDDYSRQYSDDYFENNGRESNSDSDSGYYSYDESSDGGPFAHIEDLLGEMASLQIKPPKSSEYMSNIYHYMEPHEQIVVDVKIFLREIIDHEIFFAIHKKSLEQGMRRPEKNELAEFIEKLLDFIERLSMAREPLPGPASRCQILLEVLEKEIFSRLNAEHLNGEKATPAFAILNVDKTRMKKLDRYFGQVSARVRNHFGSAWKSKTKDTSSLLKTSLSSSVVANEITTETSPVIGSSNGTFAAPPTPFFSANRSPQTSRISVDSPLIKNALTVREDASKLDEALSGSDSTRSSPRSNAPPLTCAPTSSSRGFAPKKKRE